MVGTLQLSRATTLIPFLSFLDDRGALVDQALEQAYLPLKLRERPECYVATKLFWNFVSQVAHREGVEDLGLEVGHRAGVAVLGSDLHARVARSPALADALQTFCERVKHESTGMKCWVDANGDLVEFHVTNAFGPEVPGYRQQEWLTLMSMVTVLQMFLGPTWEPTSISLRSVSAPPTLANELFPGTVFMTEQPHAFIAFPRGALGLSRIPATRSPRFATPPLGELERLGEAPAHGLVGALTQSIEPYLPDGYPDVTLGARIADISIRMLQSRLSEHGVSYSAIVDAARFRAAAKLLRGTDASCAEIATAVGYSHASHFARQFRRLVGMSPLEFRHKAGQAQA